jgi:pyruvate dehydrogenase E1 component
MEERLTAIMRWNALAMVVRANQAYGELGGHIASYASAAEIFEVGFNHFFRAAGEPAAIWCSSSRIRRRASTRAPSSRGG